MEYTSFQLKKDGYLHTEYSRTSWGYPEGLKELSIKKSTNSHIFFELDTKSFVIKIKRKGIITINWLQDVLSVEDQEIEIQIRDQFNVKMKLLAGKTDLINLSINLGYGGFGLPHDLIIEIMHLKPLTFLSKGIIDIMYL
ncbi:hypothetical protein [Marispirochaeta sp.]|uniref:hypothetical protein n=1 Tax=Marispirochaeta sp. TaxID=2038653 RepID=UPI0029C83220|nr:hypothetical protein [Marispirochaeta sp.]